MQQMVKTTDHNRVRADIVTRRTYCRPINEDETEFETWDDGVTPRVIGHQRWLWETAQGHPLNPEQEAELAELGENIRARKTSLAGRTNWLGGTDIAKRRASSNFNCSFREVITVHDVVDIFWLLLQGCGTGFKAKDGTLSGFTKPAKVSVVRSERTIEDYHNGFRGRETNQERIVKKKGKAKYILSIGDSAQAWAKSVGKLLALKEPIDEIVLDFSEIRAGGVRLKGYGWISSGDEVFSRALQAICGILNNRAGQLLSKMDIHDVLNWLGTTLSSRRSAEISVMDFGDPEWEEFALCKKDHFTDNPQRAQSNNSTLFYRKPSRLELRALFHIMEEGGGSEPAIINAVEAKRRAPWFSGVNP